MSARADRITLKGRVGEIAAWCLAVIAWAISYGTQVALAAAHGFHGPADWEAVGMGALADLASLSMMLLALDQAERGKSARLTWVVSLLAAGMMEWANVVYAGSDRVAVLLHAWPPFLAVILVFVLVHVRRTNAAPVAAGSVIDVSPVSEPNRSGPNRTAEPLSGPPTHGSLPEPPAPRALPSARVTKAMWAEALSALGPNATNEQLADRLGCHQDSVRRYRRRFAAVRGLPRVVSSDT